MTKQSRAEDLLIEIGCEELPSKDLQRLQKAFIEGLSQQLIEAELTFTHIYGFTTPRRLAVRIEQLSTVQPTRTIRKRGPTRAITFDKEGNPSIPALKFAETCKVPFEKLTFQETEKGSWLVFEQEEPGLSTEQLFPKILMEVLNHLPITKRMLWGSNEFSFVRPVHWIILLFGDNIIETEIFGIKSGRETRGHRFHHPQPIPIPSPQTYEQILLEKGYVIADFNKRRDKIQLEMQKIASAHNHHLVHQDYEALLDEVTGLVEWPVVLSGQFDLSFLEIPKEALVSAMQVHQKCFPLADNHGKLLSKFLIVSNIQSKDPQTVIDGNNWVMKARLADAAFYYRIDKEIPLHQRNENLHNIVFQAGLGTLWDKSKRIAYLAKFIAREINADSIYTERAALLCKADLLTQMVGEFPELQGIMGRYYALHHSEPIIVANAIEEHYYPRFAQDILPASLEGACIAISDRIDSLVGIFALGKRPTGDKDPFGLRRQAMGVLRIILEKELNLDLITLLGEATRIYSDTIPTLNVTTIASSVLEFCFERLRAWYHDQGISSQVFESVLAKNPTNPLDFHKRILAVSTFRTLPEAEALAAANKRVKNILTKNENTIPTDRLVNLSLLTEKAEKDLESQLSVQEKMILPLMQKGNYTDALKSLATLHQPVDQFFTEVMVMVDDESLRNNRLRLLNRLRELFLNIADVSLL